MTNRQLHLDDNPAQAEEMTSEESRQFLRHNLRDKSQEDLRVACDGITIPLMKSYWWGTRVLGIANIKDIGLGGIGFITSSALSTGQQLNIKLKGTQLKVELVRCLEVNKKLNFYGAKWLTPEGEVRLILGQIRKSNLTQD